MAHFKGYSKSLDNSYYTLRHLFPVISWLFATLPPKSIYSLKAPVITCFSTARNLVIQLYHYLLINNDNGEMRVNACGHQTSMPIFLSVNGHGTKIEYTKQSLWGYFGFVARIQAVILSILTRPPLSKHPFRTPLDAGTRLMTGPRIQYTIHLTMKVT